jgi:hypothetical protein
MTRPRPPVGLAWTHRRGGGGRAIAATAAIAGLLLLLPGVALGQWASAGIPGTGAVNQLGLVFDGAGRGLLTWEGFDQQASPQRFSAADVRDATGAWRRQPNLPGIGWGGAAVYDYAGTHALMIARQVSGVGAFNRARYRLVYAVGRSDGTFAAPRRLAENVAPTVASAANARGEALVTYDDARTGALSVSERVAGRAFGRPRRLGTGSLGAAAINARGDRVLAWWGRTGVWARIRLAGGSWGPQMLAAKATPVANGSLRAAVTPGGRVVVGWATADIREGVPLGLAAGIALHERAGSWHAFGLERSTLASALLAEADQAIPVIDSLGRTYVAWTGAAAAGLAVKLGQLTAAGVRGVTVPSGAISGAAVDDAAAGPHAAIVISWSVAAPPAAIVYASLRGSGGAFAAPELLTPAGARGIGGSRAAFEPLTGQAVVTWSAVGSDGRAVLNAAVSPAS